MVSPVKEACSGHHEGIQLRSLTHPVKSEKAFWRNPHLIGIPKGKKFELARSSEERKEAEKGSSVSMWGNLSFFFAKSLGHTGNIVLFINHLLCLGHFHS